MDIGNKDTCSVCLKGPAWWYRSHGDRIFVCDDHDPLKDVGPTERKVVRGYVGKVW